jgi:MerR family transcriptional regulator, mercuric resistance operon regulatory protein
MALALTIGMLAATTGCAVDTVRYYERAGLLPRPPRTRGGHRQYAEADRKRLLVIRRARQLGFNLAEIRAVLALADRQVTDCAAIRGVATRHLEGLERQIRALETGRDQLRRLIAACARDGGPACPLLDALAGERNPRAAVTRPAGRPRSEPR